MAVRLIGGSIAGLVLGYAGAQVLHLQAATLIPWALVGLGVGALCRTAREALLAGVAYGFVLGLSFMVFDYTGTDPIVGKLPFFVGIGVIGAVAGAVLGYAGWWRWHRWGRRADD